MTFMRARRVAVLALVAVAACGNELPADGFDMPIGSDPEQEVQGATLKVTDANGVGATGDNRLSLSEAIALANGGLRVDQLSAAEKALVRGQPGAGRADRIQVAVREIRLPAAAARTQSALPRLIGNDFDSLDGQGVVLKEGAWTPVDTALVAASSQLTIANFRFDNVWRAVLIDPQGPVDVHHVTVRGNRFLGVMGNAVEISGSRAGSGGSLHEVMVDNNKFDMPTEPTHFSYGVAIRACQLDSPDDIAPVTKGVVSDVLLEGIYLRNNEIRGGAETIVVNVGSVHGKGEAKDCTVRKLVINDNVLGGSFDMLVNINVAITYAFAASITSFLGGPQMDLGAPGSAAVLRNIVLEDVEIARNKMESAGTAALSLYCGIDSISKEDPSLSTIEDCALRKVRVTDNTHVNLEGKRTICNGINIVAGHFDYVAGGTSTRNQISDVEISGNAFSGCESGIRVAAAELIGAGGYAHDNRVSNVRISNNELSDNHAGMQILAAEGTNPQGLFSLFGLDHPNVGTLEKNVLENVEVRGNKITGNDIGLEVIGGRSSVPDARRQHDIVRDNTLQNVALTDNTVTGNKLGNCVAENNMVSGPGPATVEGNGSPSDACHGI
jgi:hypothetical protein